MKSILLLLALTLPDFLFGQTPVQESLKYLGETRPGKTPVKFAPGLVSLPDEHEFGSVFSRNGTEFYYGVDILGKAEIRFMKLVNNQWTKPTLFISNEIFSYNDPMLSPDESRLYFISDRPLDESGQKKDYDIWYVERVGDKWSAPINAGPAINSGYHEYYVSFTKKGTMYFSSNRKTGGGGNHFDIYSSSVKDGKFQPPQPMGDAINSEYYEADVFIAADESYLIFCADRPEGYGRGDLYVSFRNADGSWTKAKNMGKEINTAGHELCPFVTGDGKYFFYTSNRDIYWVDASIIEALR